VAIELDQVAAALPAYEIGDELGRGSTGIVLAARHRQLGREVAIKLLPPELAENPEVRRRFVAEARLLASFSHVHVVGVYDFVEDDGLCLLVLERLGGGTLYDHARAGLDAPAGCAATLALCAALHYAHERDVLHRDVKPANVLIADDGLVKVTDFGIAKVLGGSETLSTQSGLVLGTPAYMAPEQADSAELGPATDVYGAGTVLYELLSGRLPFEREANPLQMLYSHVHTDPLPLDAAAPGVPPALAGTVMRALERDPADRHASAEELGVEVAEAAAAAWGTRWLEATPFNFAASGPIRAAAHGPDSPGTDSVLPATIAELPQAPPTDPPGGVRAQSTAPPPDGRPRRRLALVAAVVAALALAGGLVALLAGGDDEKPARKSSAQTPAVPPPTGKSDWEAVPDMPSARQQMPGTVLFGTAWIVGGLRDTVRGPVASNKVEGLDTTLNSSWQASTPLPVPVHHAMAVTYKDELVLIGGWIPKGSNLTPAASKRVFALRGDRWVELPPMATGHAAAAAGVVDGKIVVAGGQSDDRLVAATEVYDGRRWRSGAALPTPREHLAGASDGRYLYAVGGRRLSPDKNLAALERYDPDADRWEKLAGMPTPRGGLGVAIAGGRLYAVGGETPTTVLRAVEAYDIAKDRWSAVSPLRTPRHGMAVATAGGRLYAIGGGLKPGHTNSTATAEALIIR
jgi:non-specific serine/threonine protein kinase